eukprot:TRINITY_DN29573_c0_g1_i1.p1 TRINITY_DN29573_c0_g1~~TRINITY_DN29573_c0_g1_i1.p1  ORF type:complete len:534 (-),score=83.06 TRINITY_DN29573_c0_g1_i1:246-1754(-)
MGLAACGWASEICAQAGGCPDGRSLLQTRATAVGDNSQVTATLANQPEEYVLWGKQDDYDTNAATENCEAGGLLTIRDRGDCLKAVKMLSNDDNVDSEMSERGWSKDLGWKSGCYLRRPSGYFHTAKGMMGWWNLEKCEGCKANPWWSPMWVFEDGYVKDEQGHATTFQGGCGSKGHQCVCKRPPRLVGGDSTCQSAGGSPAISIKSCKEAAAELGLKWELFKDSRFHGAFGFVPPGCTFYPENAADGVPPMLFLYHPEGRGKCTDIMKCICLGGAEQPPTSKLMHGEVVWLQYKSNGKFFDGTSAYMPESNCPASVSSHLLSDEDRNHLMPSEKCEAEEFLLLKQSGVEQETLRNGDAVFLQNRKTGNFFGCADGSCNLNAACPSTQQARSSTTGSSGCWGEYFKVYNSANMGEIRSGDDLWLQLVNSGRFVGCSEDSSVPCSADVQCELAQLAESGTCGTIRFAAYGTNTMIGGIGQSFGSDTGVATGKGRKNKNGKGKR